MMTSDGNTATCSKLMVHSTGYGPPPLFELDDVTLEQEERLHERGYVCVA